jgi:phosphatidylglycerophosphate synthase
MLKTKFKDYTDEISRKVGLVFSRLPFTSNHWTYLSIVLAIIGFFQLVYYKNMFMAFVLFLTSGFLDAVDGAVARARKSVTKMGGYLDGIVDRIVEAFLLFGLLIFDLPGFIFLDYWIPSHIWIVLLLFFGTALTTHARSYASEKKVIISNRVLSWMPGILERTERLLVIGLAMLLYYVEPVYATIVLAIASILAIITFLQRVFFVFKHGVKK